MFQELHFPISWFHFFSLLVLVASVFYLFAKKQRAKNLPPSPPRLPIIGNLHQLGNLPHRSLWKLSQKYGPVLLLKLGNIPTLVVSSPETAKEVLKIHDLDCCTRPYSYGSDKLTYNALDMSYSPYNHHWREIRKVCMLELFSSKRVRFFQFIRDQEVSNLVDKLSELSENPVVVNEKIYELMNNIICRIVFGKRYGGNQFQDYNIERGLVEVVEMLGSYWYADSFTFFGKIVDKLTGMQNRLDKCFKNIDSFLEQVVVEHLDPERPKPEREDLVDILLELSKDESAPVPLSRDHIKAIAFDILVASTDTSSLTITWAMAELARNPRIMEKVQAEVRNQVGKKSMVEAEEVDNLRYLKMVVKETFRLHPPAATLLPREAMRDCNIGGYNISTKTKILVNAYAIGRDPMSWKHPDEFWPERFEDSDVDFKGRHFEYVPFGAGRRRCPGLEMGVSNVEYTLANLLYCFDWKLPNGMRKEDISMEEDGLILVRKKSPLVLAPIMHKWQQ
ncbi:oxygenase [Lithospermum erythrorhizon]|uniref:Oxygenase n=1 Tax=Lithospermum erythrorhizon TaxID=34254 RepID=A0AAV3NP26_LITER